PRAPREDPAAARRQTSRGAPAPPPPASSGKDRERSREPSRVVGGVLPGPSRRRAALTGLLFVALSFNLERIAADRTWLSRAGTGLIYLAQPVIVSLVALFPTRTGRPVGWTLTGIGSTATTAL